MSITIVILLLATGLFVGVVNTFAGAAAAVTISLLTALGLPVTVANGTNRIPVLMQCMVSSWNLHRQGYLDVKTGLKLGVPTTIGAIIGAIFAAQINPSVFQILLATILVVLLVTLFFNPTKLLRDSPLPPRPISVMDVVWFSLIGLYGGFFHIGVGYMILTVAILSLGYNIIEANALKLFVVMLYMPFTLVIFILHDQVSYSYGLIHGCGNVVGAYVATRYIKKIPMNFIRWLLIVVIAITVLDLADVISISGALEYFFKDIKQY